MKNSTKNAVTNPVEKRNSRTDQVIVDVDSRRMFLKSAGGYTLAIPFLPSLLTAFSEKAMAAGGASLRYVQFFTPLGGLQHKNWIGSNLPTTPFQLYAGQSARMDALSSLASPSGLSPVFGSTFNSLLPQMNVMLGLDSPIYWGHHRAASVGAFANTVPGYRKVSEQIDLNGMIDLDIPSLDQVVGYANGNGIYGSSISGRRRHMHISSIGLSTAWGRDDYTDLTSPVLPRDFIGSTSGAFNYLFGSVPQNQTQNSTNPLLNLVNAFWPTGKSLFKFLSGADKLALDKLFQIAQQAANDYSGPIPIIGNVAKPAGVSEQWTDDGSSLRALADIIALGFESDVNRISTFFGGDSLGLPHHSLSHSPTPTAPNTGQPELVRIHENFATNFFGHLGERLRTTQDPVNPGSSILDNSLLLWTQEHKVAHDTTSIPTVMLGSAGGRINSGKFVDFRNMANGSYGNDYVADAMYEGEIINRLWASVFYGLNIPRTAYETTRGGPFAKSLTQGYGHVIKNTASWFHTTNFNLTQIGEPWDFMKKPTTTWG